MEILRKIRSKDLQRYILEYNVYPQKYLTMESKKELNKKSLEINIKLINKCCKCDIDSLIYEHECIFVTVYNQDHKQIMNYFHSDTDVSSESGLNSNILYIFLLDD